MSRRFPDLSVTDLDRRRLVDCETGRVFRPVPALEDDPELPFEPALGRNQKKGSA